MSIDEKAFQKAFEMTNFAYSTFPPHIHQFVEAYEAAKVSEQPVPISLVDAAVRSTITNVLAHVGHPACLSSMHDKAVYRPQNPGNENQVRIISDVLMRKSAIPVEDTFAVAEEILERLATCQSERETSAPDQAPLKLVLEAVVNAQNNIYASKYQWDELQRARTILTDMLSNAPMGTPNRQAEVSKSFEEFCAQQFYVDSRTCLSENDLICYAEEIAKYKHVWDAALATKRAPDWLPLKDAPLDTLGFLWADGFERMGTPDMGRVYACDDGSRSASGSCKGFTFTHWHPLLLPPDQGRRG